MSRNKTCPISNFTSEEDSDGMARFYVEARGLTNLFRRKGSDDLVEARIATERVNEQNVPNLKAKVALTVNGHSDRGPLSSTSPGSAAHSARCRKSEQPSDTSRRSLDPDKIC